MKVVTYIWLITLLTFLWACNNTSKNCEIVQEWKIREYKIIKSKCQDLVLSYYYAYDIYLNDERKGSVNQIDSCMFAWQASNDRYLTLNTCDNTINEIMPIKKTLTLNSIDSITIFSNERKLSKRLTITQIETFVTDWNNSIVRDYKDISLDSAFSIFPAYQYKLTVFEDTSTRQFYGYNFLILDDSKWQYEMNRDKKLDYFHNYWRQ